MNDLSYICMMKVNLIYGLRDPRNDVYYYIGKSTIGQDRPLSHLVKSHNNSVNLWINELKKLGMIPYVDIIEKDIALENLIEREKYWIDYHHDINPDLFNILSLNISVNKLRTQDDDSKFNYLIKIIFDLGNILKNERISRNLTQEELSKKTGISRSTISLCENGCNVNLNAIKKYVTELKGIDIINKNLSKKRVKTSHRV